MTASPELRFWARRRPPVLLQTEATECGVACLAMIAAYHGQRTDVATLRDRLALGGRGMSLAQLVRCASLLDLQARPVTSDLKGLKELRLPCILHWDMNHFVVLISVSKAAATIIDPASGELTLEMREVSKRFSGVAVELTPSASFERKNDVRRVSLKSLLGDTGGLYGPLVQIGVIALVLELFAIVSPLFLQLVVDNVVLAADRDLLKVLAAGFALALLIQIALSLARSWAVLHISTQLGIRWVGNVFGHLIRLPMDYFERRHLGDVVSRFSSVNTIQRAITTSLVESVLDGLLCVACLLMMCAYSVQLAAISMTAGALYAALRYLAFGPLRAASSEQIVLNAKQQSLFLESIRGIQTIKLFGAEQDRQTRLMNAVVDVANRDVSTQRLQMLFNTCKVSIAGFETLLTIYLGAALVIDGALSTGMLLAFISYKVSFSARFTELINKLMDLKMLGLQGERLSDIVFSKTEVNESTESPAPPLQGGLCIEASNVSFRYGTDQPWVLRGVSLRIEAGESVAITGASGSGKTTLLKLLVGLLKPTEGAILVNGVPLEQFGLHNFRRSIGSVMQDDQLFSGSMEDNICLFDQKPDRRWIEACAQVAAVHDEISSMPMRYRTPIGDMGSTLSGGQKQRVLLARALYRRPAVLFLDEATSHLDVERERSINNNVKGLPVTRIIVAHRPQTIASAPRVICLEGGVVAKDLRLSEARLHAGQLEGT